MLQDVWLLLLILCNLQPTHFCSDSDTFGSAHQLGSTSTKSLSEIAICIYPVPKGSYHVSYVNSYNFPSVSFTYLGHTSF